MPTDKAVTTKEPIEIFRAGNYGAKGSYSEDDLKQIAADYSADVHEAPVTIDHEQKGPAYGWVKKLFAKGKSLYADIDFMPEFAEVIKSGHFKKRSVEIFSKLENTGRSYLAAVSWLGAQRPHIKGMPDATFSLNGDTQSFDFSEGEDAGVSRLGGGPDNRHKAKATTPAHAFAEIPTAPEGNYGVIVRNISVGETLEHFHAGYVDEEGNGFTSYAMSWDEVACKYVTTTDKHFHTISAYTVTPSGDIEHTHTAHKPEMFSEEGREAIMAENKNKEEEQVSEKKEQTKETPQTVDIKQFNELQDKLKATEEKLEIEARERKESDRKREIEGKVSAFREGVSELTQPGKAKLTPAQAKNVVELYSASLNGNETVKFGEGDNATEHDLGSALLAIFSENKAVNFSEDTETDIKHFGDKATDSDPEKRSQKNTEKARKLAAEKNITFKEALLEVQEISA